MEQYEPLHADKHRSTFNFTLAVSLCAVAIGLYELSQDGIGFLLIIGLTFAAFSWLTTPGWYMIYSDRLVIAYGKPRVRHVYFRQIDRVELITLPFGNRLLVRLRNSRRILIQPKDVEEFQSKFRGAIESYLQERGLDLPEQE